MTRLVRLELFETRLPLVAPFETSFGKVDHREPIIVRLEDSDGVVGWGESPVAYRPHFNAETNVTACPLIAPGKPMTILCRKMATSTTMHCCRSRMGRLIFNRANSIIPCLARCPRRR